MKNLFYLILFALLTFGTVGCSNSEDEPVIDEPTPEEPAKPDPDEELKKYWENVANESTIAFVNHFWNKDRKFFNTFVGKADTSAQDWCYWPQAHAMDVVIDAYVRSGNKAWKSYFDAWYVGVKQKSGGSYYNDFVDDMEWICLTMIRLYEHTGDKKYINTAEDLWTVIKRN